MKLQNMTVIFSIIIIPITLILSAYIGFQLDTVLLWQQYDTKLLDATHDAVVAFELNTVNNKYSTNADSIRRDIKAAVNAFSTSLATGFGTSGASSNTVMPYIPALVFTLYDGYYIYSPHKYNYEYAGEQKTGYEHILKPYIHYSARYKNGDDNDITVNYSLDNYVTIYGYLDDKYISYSGYLIDVDKLEVSNGTVTGYKINGVTEQIDDENAKKYYQEAYTFTKWVTTNTILIGTVKPENAIRSNGDKFAEFANDNTEVLNISSSNDPEDRASAFTQHKREIMRLSIQDNLNNAIAVYNDNSPSMGTHANFKMPVLTDDDWEKILTNVNVISFMEGMPVGTKIYNNYSIVTSTQNKQYINPNSIYFIAEGDDSYHRVNCPNLEALAQPGTVITGYKSLDFEKVKIKDENNKEGYTYKHKQFACYTCIVNSLSEEKNIEELPASIQKSYYTALARERYDLDKVTKMLDYTKTKN